MPVCMCWYGHWWHFSGGQRTTCRNWFSDHLSPRIKPRWSGLAVGTFIHRAILLFLCFFYSLAALSTFGLFHMDNNNF